MAKTINMITISDSFFSARGDWFGTNKCADIRGINVPLLLDRSFGCFFPNYGDTEFPDSDLGIYIGRDDDSQNYPEFYAYLVRKDKIQGFLLDSPEEIEYFRGLYDDLNLEEDIWLKVR